MKHFFLYVIFFYSLIAGFLPLYSKVPYTAVVALPVIDLVGQSYYSLHKGSSNTDSYKYLPLCGKKGAEGCLRIHQLVFNEVVSVLEEVGDEVFIKIPQTFYEFEGSTNPQDTFWTLKKNLVSLATLEKNGMNIKHIPEPLSYKNCNYPHEQNIIVLIQPFHDTHSKRIFSVGTRFVVADIQESDKNFLNVWADDYINHKSVLLSIPKKIAVFSRVRDVKSARSLFVSLIRAWANPEYGVIFYVWGGCSFCYTCPDSSFSLVEAKSPAGKKVEFFVRPQANKLPHTGFDCTGLILRAAQASGMPYYFKNSATIKKNLPEIHTFKELQEGDLLWYPGHAMVVTDIKRNLIAEASGYQSAGSQSYGKVHEIPLRKAFKGVHTYKDLCTILEKKGQLERLDRFGKPCKKIEFKLLSLENIWRKK